MIKRMLPVTVRFVNKPPAGQKIGETSVEPESVSVLGPAEEVRHLVSVETLPIDLEDNRSTIKRKVRLSTGGKPFSFSLTRWRSRSRWKRRKSAGLLVILTSKRRGLQEVYREPAIGLFASLWSQARH